MRVAREVMRFRARPALGLANKKDVKILKHQVGTGRARHLYYFRDQQGLEIDFVVPAGHRRLVLVEAKASRTVVPRRGASLDRLSAAVKRYRLNRFLVYRPQGEAARLSALRPGVQAGDLERLLTLIGR